MFKYSSIYINVLSLLISLIIFIFTQLFFSNYDTFTKKSSLKAGFQVQNIASEKFTNGTENTKQDEEIKKTEEKK